MTRNSNHCLIFDGGKIQWLADQGSGKGIRPIAGCDAPETQAPATVESARALAAAAIALFGDQRPRSVTLGLPSAWLDHFVLDSKGLTGLDDLAFRVREVAKRGSIPADDMLLATPKERRSARVPTKRARGTSSTTLVVATKESPVEALVLALARAGISVRAACSSIATLLSTVVRGASDVEGSATESPAITTFVIRESGFAIAVSSAATIHQFRIVAVDLPRDASTLAQVVAEEVRRSTIYFREQHRGKAVSAIRVLGRFEGDSEDLRSRIAALASLETTLVGAMGPSADLELEAAALLSSDVHRAGFDLLPREGFRARAPWLAAAPAAVLVALSCAGLVSVANRLNQQADDSGRTQATFVAPDLAATSSQERNELSSRLDRFSMERDALASIGANRVDLPFVLAAAGSALDPNCRFDSVSCSAPIVGTRVVRIQGHFVDSYWEFEPRLESLVRDLTQRTGYRFFVPDDARPIRTDAAQEFEILTTMESASEPAGS